jgi:hypothetical protein
MASRNFVDANVKLDQNKQSLTVSRIFQWFKGDFGGQAGIVSFLINHLPHDRRHEWLITHKDDIQLRYEPYNWGLNTT